MRWMNAWRSPPESCWSVEAQSISKALRADERDLQHLAALHERDPLDFDTLVSRFRDEMLPIYVGDVVRIIDYFLWVVEELFGEAKLVKARRLLRAKDA